MQLIDPLVKRPMDRVMTTFRDRKYLLEGKGYIDHNDPIIGDGRFTAENVHRLGVNGFFQVYSKDFDITPAQGRTLADYFREGEETFEFIEDLHRAYPFMGPERTEYLEQINSIRQFNGIRQIKSPLVR